MINDNEEVNDAFITKWLLYINIETTFDINFTIIFNINSTFQNYKQEFYKYFKHSTSDNWDKSDFLDMYEQYHYLDDHYYEDPENAL